VSRESKWAFFFGGAVTQDIFFFKTILQWPTPTPKTRPNTQPQPGLEATFAVRLVACYYLLQHRSKLQRRFVFFPCASSMLRLVYVQRLDGRRSWLLCRLRLPFALNVDGLSKHSFGADCALLLQKRELSTTDTESVRIFRTLLYIQSLDSFLFLKMVHF
jgi:hypothetical protein